MDTKKKVMLAVFLLFLLIVGIITYDMARRTTSPWSKKKFEEKYRVK